MNTEQSKLQKILNLKVLFWVTYFGLLIVMFPHTQWVAYQIYDDRLTAIAFAIVFELGILGFSVSFKTQIEEASKFRPRKRKNVWLGDTEYLESSKQLYLRKQLHTYFNVYFFGLIISGLLSGLANFSYAVEFGDTKFIAITQYPILSLAFYHVGFGLILPAVAILFAFVLAERTSFDEISEDQLKIADLTKQLRQKQKELVLLTDNVNKLEKLQDNNSKSVRLLTILKKNTSKEKRLIAAFTLFPNINNSGAAIIARCDPSYVTGLKKSWGGKIPEIR